LVDAALIDVANHNLEGAAAMLSRLEPRRAARSKTLDFMANYSYDFLNPLLAAELWSRLGGEKDLANAASALYVAGESEKARNLWLLLAKEANASSGDNAYGRAEAADKLKILYNLALTAENESEKSFFLEQLLADTDYVSENREEIIAALIMYTRLQSPERARAMLLEQPFGEQEALLDLEQLDRSLETLPPELAAADTWLVLNRHSKTPELYRWAAWYFEYQRRYDELDALRRFAAKHQMEDPYLDFHEALGLIRTERSNEGAALLENIEGVPAWQRFANIALVYEARREYAAALHSYEMAAAEISRESGQRLRAAAGRIYLRMARIRRVLGESPERVRRDLERAYELDSENINIRLALRNASG
ncbi:MAG: hypothetical protein LBH18_07690, partial [Spirochaetaceae bacterium]|nr:hypothetical protein [Spirochaetaceae bacterium]